MSFTRVFVSVLLVLSLSLYLVGCIEGKDSSLTSGQNGLLGDSDNYIAGRCYLHTIIDENGNVYTPEEYGYPTTLYIRLYKDGTAVMNGNDMIYANGKIWYVEDPDRKFDLSIIDKGIIIKDNDVTIIFKKQ